MAGACLRIELFPTSLTRAIDFYTRVLGFTLLRHEPDSPDSDGGYAYVSRDAIRIGFATKDVSQYPQSVKNPADRSQFRMWPVGVEIVVEVDDLKAERERVVQAGWPLDEDVKSQEWGLTDFRIRDPDGYYLRITDKGSRDGRGVLIRDGGVQGEA